MFKFIYFSVLILPLFFLFYFVTNAGNYLDGALLRAEDDVKVYLINNNTKRWVSSIEVFNFNNFKWQNVKIISKKEMATIKEKEPIVSETTTPATVSTGSPQTSPTITPTVDAPPIPPTPKKINPQFPAPDYIRADWLISHTTSNYARIGQRIVFRYSDKKADKIENFRLYEKKPGHAYFVQIASFEEIPSTGCEDIDIDGEWMMIEAGQCGYWSVQKIVPPGGRNSVAYLSAEKYSEGEYGYYVVGVDKDGSETRPSPETKLVFLKPVDIFSPIDSQQTVATYPVFKWNIYRNWPVNSISDYFIMFSDDKNAQNPLWAKQLKITARSLDEQEIKRDESFVYDGFGLDSSKKYKVYIYGHYRKSEYDPDYISIPSSVPEFRVKSTSPWTSFLGSLRALFFGGF